MLTSMEGHYEGSKCTTVSIGPVATTSVEEEWRVPFGYQQAIGRLCRAQLRSYWQYHLIVWSQAALKWYCQAGG